MPQKIQSIMAKANLLAKEGLSLKPDDGRRLKLRRQVLEMVEQASDMLIQRLQTDCVLVADTNELVCLEHPDDVEDVVSPVLLRHTLRRDSRIVNQRLNSMGDCDSTMYWIIPANPKVLKLTNLH